MQTSYIVCNTNHSFYCTCTNFRKRHDLLNIYVIWYKDYLFCFYRLEKSIEWNTPLCSNSLIQSTQVLEETLLQILYLLGFLLRLPIIYGKLSITTPLICLFFPKKSKSLMSKRHYRLFVTLAQQKLGSIESICK